MELAGYGDVNHFAATIVNLRHRTGNAWHARLGLVRYWPEAVPAHIGVVRQASRHLTTPASTLLAAAESMLMPLDF